MSYDDNHSGAGPANQPDADAHLGEESRNGNSQELSSNSVPKSEPSFAPDQLNQFEGTSFEFIKLHSPNDMQRGGQDLGKVPRKGWRVNEPEGLEGARAILHSMCNVGVRLRPSDLVIDVDPRNFEADDDPLQRLVKDLGLKLSDYPKVVTGSGGFHFYMSKPVDVAICETLVDYPGLEFKGHGRQVVAPGSVHPITGKPYLWDDDPLAASVDCLPKAPSSLLKALQRPVAKTDGDPGGGITPDQLEDMLEGLDIENYRGHEQWLEIMMASHHATGGEGRQEFIAWSIGDPAYSDQAGIIGRRWDSLHADAAGKRVTEKTLFKALHDVGKGDLIPRSPAAEDFPSDVEKQNETGIYSPENALENINSQHFTVLTAGKYLVGRERPSPYSGFMQVEWFPDEAIRKHLDNRSVIVANVKGDQSKKPLGSWWIKHPKRRQYEGVVFDPSPSADHPDLYNLWRGWSVEPKQGDWSLMKRLLKDVLCGGNEQSFEYVLKWSAFMVQHPHVAAEVAVVFRGAKGAGKGTFARALMNLAGLHGLQVAQTEHFTGRFNEHLSDKIFLFVDEGIWGGDKKLEGAVKNLITEPNLTFEGKNKPIVSGPNRLHVMIASNEDWVVPASNDERRFAIFEADHLARNELPENFFDKLHRQMKDGGNAAMLHELMDMNIEDWHPRQNVPVTEALVDQKLEGLRSDPIAFWWYRKLEDGVLNCLVGVDNWQKSPILAGSQDKDSLIDDLSAQARAMGKRAEFSKTKLARSLKEFGVDVKVRGDNGGRCWRLPILDEARSEFETWLGGKIAWDSDI